MRYENPKAVLESFEKTDWLDIGQRMLLLCGVAGVAAALGVQLSAAAAGGEFCYPVLQAADGCGAYLGRMQAMMYRLFGVGAALVVAAAGAEVVRDG